MHDGLLEVVIVLLQPQPVPHRLPHGPFRVPDCALSLACCDQASHVHQKDARRLSQSWASFLSWYTDSGVVIHEWRLATVQKTKSAINFFNGSDSGSWRCITWLVEAFVQWQKPKAPIISCMQLAGKAAKKPACVSFV